MATLDITGQIGSDDFETESLAFAKLFFIYG